MQAPVTTQSPYALPPGAGRCLAWFSSTVTIKASNPGVGFTEVRMIPGDEPPLHIHKYEDEWLYLLEGAMTFHVGGENHPAAPGAFVCFPRGIAHTFSVESPVARFLVVNTPGGFERMFERQAKSPEEAVSALTAFGMDVVGPHPRQAKAA